MSKIAPKITTIEDFVLGLKANGSAFALATVVRTVGSTSATPGAKAVLDSDGAVIYGWLGGGCARGAVARAAKDAFSDGVPKLVSIAPKDKLESKGVQAGDNVEGIQFANNGCPSRGSIDVFIEPVVPAPTLVVLGNSPVANALVSLAPSLHWAVSQEFPESAKLDLKQAVVIATQGQGDLEALKTTLATRPSYVAFVGSARKFASLSEKLAAEGVSNADIHAVHAPAGLDIGAETPEEIAISILADLIQHRRQTTHGDQDA